MPGKPTEASTDEKAAETASDLGEMNHFQLLEFLKHFTNGEVKEWQDKLNFNELEFNVEERRQMIVNTCLERFNDQYVSVMIAEYARNLFDGVWRTSNRVVLYELEKEQLVGYFNGYLLLGKVVGDEVLFHQYNKHKQHITVYFKMDVTHNKLDGHFYTGEKPNSQAPPAPLEMYRADVPYFMAMKAVQHDDIQRLEKLRKQFSFDFNQALPEASNYTILHNAVANNRPAIVKFLLEENVDLDKKNALMQTAFDIAVASNLTTIIECFPREAVITNAIDRQD